MPQTSLTFQTWQSTCTHTATSLNDASALEQKILGGIKIEGSTSTLTSFISFFKILKLDLHKV